ncbi:MAG: hypothetical protein AAGJ50_12225, partial [Pseudomonadota bacterium]
AVAVLRSAWPQLSAAETVEIILESATDLGAPGTDPVFGRGLLNLGAALEPSGTLSVSTATGASVPVTGFAAAISPVFGSQLLDIGPVVALDRFGRDFQVDLPTAAGAPNRFQIGGVVQPFRATTQTSQALPAGGSLAVRVRASDGRLLPERAIRSLGAASFNQPEPADLDIALAFTQPISTDTSIAVARGYSGREVDQLLRPSLVSSTLALGAFSDVYIPASANAVSFSAQKASALGTTFDILVNLSADETPETSLPFVGQQEDEQSATNVRLGVTKQTDAGLLRVEFGVLSEESTLFGADLPGALFGQASGTDTVYTSIAGQTKLWRNFSAVGRFSTGFTDVPTNGSFGLVVDADRLRSSQFSVGLQAAGLLSSTDAFSISLNQPLHARGGGVTLSLPTAFDQLAEQATFTDVAAGFGDGDRPLDLEVSYSLSGFAGARLDLNAGRSVSGSGRGQTAIALRLRTTF